VAFLTCPLPRLDRPGKTGETMSDIDYDAASMSCRVFSDNMEMLLGHWNTAVAYEIERVKEPPYGIDSHVIEDYEDRRDKIWCEHVRPSALESIAVGRALNLPTRNLTKLVKTWYPAFLPAVGGLSHVCKLEYHVARRLAALASGEADKVRLECEVRGAGKTVLHNPQKPPAPADSARSFKPGPDGVLEGLREWARGLAKRVGTEGDSRAYRPGGRPTDEGAIAAMIRDPLRQYAEARGASLAPGQQTGRGPTDFLIHRGNDRVYIELKRSCGDWKQGITAELPTYMAASSEDHAVGGLFLVFAFEGAFKADGPDTRELLALRDTECGRTRRPIHVGIIDCGKPKSASKMKNPASPYDALQWYRWAPDTAEFERWPTNGSGHVQTHA
jgi:hypothetical protein